MKRKLNRKVISGFVALVSLTTQEKETLQINHDAVISIEDDGIISVEDVLLYE